MDFGWFLDAFREPEVVKNWRTSQKKSSCVLTSKKKQFLIGLGPGKSLFLMQPSIGERYFCTVRNFLGFFDEKVGFGMPKGSQIKVRGITKTGPETNMFHSKEKVGAEELCEICSALATCPSPPRRRSIL